MQDMTFDEIDSVGGGVVPLIIAIAYFGIGLSAGTLALGRGFYVGLRFREVVEQ